MSKKIFAKGTKKKRAVALLPFLFLGFALLRLVFFQVNQTFGV